MNKEMIQVKQLLGSTWGIYAYNIMLRIHWPTLTGLREYIYQRRKKPAYSLASEATDELVRPLSIIASLLENPGCRASEQLSAEAGGRQHFPNLLKITIADSGHV